MICQTDNAAGEVYPILTRCRKSHVKQQIQFELTCFSPFLAKRCLHVANDFRVYSQLLLPIYRLSAYTLCLQRHKTILLAMEYCNFIILGTAKASLWLIWIYNKYKKYFNREKCINASCRFLTVLVGSCHFLSVIRVTVVV